MLEYVRSFFIEILHIFLMFFPVIIYFVDIPKWIIIFSLIGFVSLPFLWFIFNNKCILSTLVSKLNNDERGFSEKYLMWLYNPLKVFLIEPITTKNIVNLGAWTHWYINVFLIWFYIFFYNKKKFF